ncbi:MAG TPA: YkvA family protein [Bacteroidota bacterium]|nr:YkvA family protein [Bacteroidota bacterium]
MRAKTSAGAIDREQFDRDVQYVFDNFDRKLAKLGERLWFLKHVRALYRYVKDPDIHWLKKSLIVGALVYFIVPVDAIPDFTPFVGYLDDALVIAAAVKTIGRVLAKYYDDQDVEQLQTFTAKAE